ncbi:hypothetical protein VHEMI00797 [[Torrubiella] hemipterigena]|uniref:Cell wall protein n=1 Tax=[Torrubiella] hemipterigena TaxID=1531966 RepID=A0A0A1SK88_9HYPO|nr:hypothetical protein VHEMI00797 [[Torrubiella] hemipterigena]
MRFHAFAATIFSLVAIAYADADEPDHGATAKSILQNLRQGFEALAGAANQFHGSPDGLTSAASGLLENLEADLVRMKNIPSLKATQCLPLVSPALKVEKHGNILAGVLKARRPEIELHSLCDTVEGFLSRGVDTSAEFMEVLKRKVPLLVRPVVKLSGDMTIKTLKQLRDHFSSDVCINRSLHWCPRSSPLMLAPKHTCLVK